MSLHGAVGIPLTMGFHSGNTSDHVANRDHLARLADLLPDPTDVTVVADCKLVDGDTLGRLTASGFHFVSLVPKTFKLRHELVDQAWSAAPDVANWPILASKPGAKKADPMLHYRGRSFTADFPLTFPSEDGAPPVESDEKMRFLVVHSDTLAKRFDKSLETKLAREA